MIPENYMTFALFMIPARYFIIAGIFYLLFYILKKEGWIHLKINKEFPPKDIIRTEILYSFVTMMIFALVALLIFKLHWSGYTLIYVDMNKYGVPYFIFSIFLYMIAHDLYFYITHRIMHHKKIYPIVHKIHHISINPTPWAAFSFHPIEAFIQIAWIPIIILLIPTHVLTLAIWVLYMMLFNVVGHLGYEFFPKNFVNSIFGQIFFTSSFHNMHHRKNNCNYGLYFVVWDRLLGTTHHDYESSYNNFYLDKENNVSK